MIAASIPTLTRTTLGTAVVRVGLALTVTRGFSLRVETKSTQARHSRQRAARTGAHQRREHPLARPLTNPRGERCLPRTPDTTTMGATRTPPMLVGDPVPTERPAAHSCKATGTTDPPIPSTGPARRRTPVSDLFHEPEAHPKTAATGIPPMVTVRGHRPAPGRPSLIQALTAHRN